MSKAAVEVGAVGVVMTVASLSAARWWVADVGRAVMWVAVAGGAEAALGCGVGEGVRVKVRMAAAAKEEKGVVRVARPGTHEGPAVAAEGAGAAEASSEWEGEGGAEGGGGSTGPAAVEGGGEWEDDAPSAPPVPCEPHAPHAVGAAVGARGEVDEERPGGGVLG